MLRYMSKSTTHNVHAVQRAGRLLVIGLVIALCQFLSNGQYQIGSLGRAVASTVSANSIDMSVVLPFPHPYVNGGMSSSGVPFVGIPGDANALNPAVLDAYARYPLIFLNVTPATDIRPDIIPALRQRNATQPILGYLNSTLIWCPQDGNGNISYPTGSYYRDIWTTVTTETSCASASDRMLWFQDGQRTDAVGTNVNLAHFVLQPDGVTKRYDVAEDEAQTIYDHVVATKKLDGLFMDVFCPGIMWMETPANPSRLFDYQRAGYGTNNADPANRSAFDLGWQAGHTRLAQHLRELAGPSFPLIGNCAQAPAAVHPYLNGWDRENYPFQNGGTFFSNMLSWPWGYLHQDANFLQPPMNIIYSIAQSSGGTMNPYSAANQRIMRYGLGSTSLGDGWFLYGDGDNGTNSTTDTHYTWWNDEDGVITNVPQSDPTYGHAAEGAQYGGWLGNPTSHAYNVLGSNFASTPDFLTANQSFETAGVDPATLVNWNTRIDSGFSANSVVRDTTNAADGSASAKISIVNADSTNASVTDISTGSMTISSGTQYTVSFKAKATASLPVEVWLGSYGNQTVRVDQEWHQYQAVITAGTSSSNAAVVFALALQTGTYWIDDVHVQVGNTGLWRRDFEKGIVLVNPNSNAITVTLEKPYMKISGAVNPTLNDGSMVTQVTIPGTSSMGGTGDALFLLSVDRTPPAVVNNLGAN